MQQLTCLVLDNPALDQDVLTVAAGICSLRRLYASAEWAVLPAGPWQHTVRSLVRAYSSCRVHAGLSWADGGLQDAHVHFVGVDTAWSMA